MCSFEFDEEMEGVVYKFNGERLYNLKNTPDKYNSDTVSALFTEEMNKLIDSGLTTVFVKYDWNILDGLKRVADDYNRLFASRWVFVSFFHDDKDTLKLPVSGPPYAGPIDQKADWLLDMAELPFIKKVEIPLDTVLTWDYIKELFQEYVEW
jgi:hypothetical protein